MGHNGTWTGGETRAEHTTEKRGRMKQRKQNRYTVYDNKTDFPVIVSGTAMECAEAMGIKVKTFYAALTSKYSGERWHIIKEDEDE